ncbi:hypothetical protein OROGR_006048 [Orobanche gracilis]
MDQNKTFTLHLLFLSFITFRVLFVSSQDEDNVRCLKGIKNTLHDPQNRLSTWQFDNNTVVSYATSFELLAGTRENRVLGLELRDFKLLGQIPDSLKYCGKSLQRLDLGSNSLTSEIPSEICSWNCKPPKP